jgi:hypothetical protein
MRKVIGWLLMVSAVLMCGCMRHAGRNVLQVMLIKAEKKDGSTHSRTFMFYRDGKAERNTFLTDNSAAKPVSTEERGTLSTDSFERVAKTIEENNFYSKQEKRTDPDADGEFINLAVSSKDGVNEISNDIQVDPNDPQIKNIIAAIEKEAAQINWQPAKQ